MGPTATETADQPTINLNPTLIAFDSDSEGDEGQLVQPPVIRPPPNTTNFNPSAPQKSMFGDFDPWGPTATAQSMNLLDLEDNLSPPSDSEQSEVRTVGTEAFKKKSNSLRSSPAPVSSSASPSNQFDPFASKMTHGGSDDLGEMFGNPSAFGHSSSSESLPKQSSAQQRAGGSPFGSTLQTPSTGATSLHSSAPNVSSLGNNSFAPTLSDIPQSPKQATHHGGVPAQQRRHSAMPKSYQSSSNASTFSGGRTSPFGGGNIITGTNSPLGFHAHSTGHLQQQMGTGVNGGRGTGSRSDPFSDLGNVKLGGGNMGSSPRKSSQPAPQAGPAMTNRSSYQYYNQKQPSSRHQQTSPPITTDTSNSSQSKNKQYTAPTSTTSYQPNYSSSVLRDRSERGPRYKTG